MYINLWYLISMQEKNEHPTLSYEDKADHIINTFLDPSREEGYELFSSRLSEARGKASEWEKEGFTNFKTFVSTSGDLLTLGRFEPPRGAGETEGSQDDSSSHTWAINYKGESVVVTVPKVSGFGGKIAFRGSPGAFETVFNLQDLSDDEPISPEIAWLKENFGEKLLMHSLHGKSTISSRKFSDESMINIESLLGRQNAQIEAQREAEINQAHAEATEVEARAQAARSTVRKKLFESAEKLSVRQEEAYRDSIKNS